MTIHAIYENGVFRPREAPDLAPGTEVELELSEPPSDPVAAFKARFPHSIGIMPDSEADEMLRIIDDEFARVNPDEWR